MATTQPDQTQDQVAEWLTCSESPLYFIDNYCYIYDATERTWIPFKLWKEQARTLKTLSLKRLVIILKARQLGITWLALGYALWLMLFRPAVTILLFSRRDDEAVYLLGSERLQGMYSRLPSWLQASSVVLSNAHEWALSNGSIARAFPTSAGDSYTASLVIIDEADLAPDLGQVLNAVKPTIDGGGQMVMLSRSDNKAPESQFKLIYKAAKMGLNGWTAVFLPWFVRPNRDKKWYEEQKADILHRTKSLDDLHQQYPASDVEALAARTMDKRIPPEVLAGVYKEMMACLLENLPKKAPHLPKLELFVPPSPGRTYVIGADPAEGNPTSDNSSLTILDTVTGEEVASLAGTFEPAVFASYIKQLSEYYNDAAALPERNNHGHAVILWLRQNSKVRVLVGQDKKPGWSTNATSKSYMYDKAVDDMVNLETTIHSFSAETELASIEASTLRAPEGLHDDRAMSYVLALIARRIPQSRRLGFA